MTNNESNEKAESMPQPTYAPAAMAMGVTMLAWGVVTHWTMSVAGVALCVWALWDWMSDICRAWGRET